MWTELDKKWFFALNFIIFIQKMCYGLRDKKKGLNLNLNLNLILTKHNFLTLNLPSVGLENQMFVDVFVNFDKKKMKV